MALNQGPNRAATARERFRGAFWFHRPVRHSAGVICWHKIATFFSDPEARRLLDRSCTSCHTLARVEQARNSEEAWRVSLVDMRERGIQVTDEELERLADWTGRVWGTNQDK
jgi:hypothetical protein